MGLSYMSRGAEARVRGHMGLSTILKVEIQNTIEPQENHTKQGSKGGSSHGTKANIEVTTVRVAGEGVYWYVDHQSMKDSKEKKESKKERDTQGRERRRGAYRGKGGEPCT